MKEMLNGRDTDWEREGKRWGEGGKEMGRGRERDGENEGEMVSHNSLVQMVPQVLYGVKIRAAGRPVHSVDSCLLQEGVDDSGAMGPCVVILSSEHT